MNPAMGDGLLLALGKIALTNPGTHTGIDGFRRSATTLIQTIRHGTPLSDALRKCGRTA